MAGNVHKCDHALIAEIATQCSSLVRRSAPLKNPTGAPVCFLNSAAKHSPRPRRVTILFAHKAEKTIPSA